MHYVDNKRISFEKSDVKLFLSTLFQDNCGYCGKYLPVHKQAERIAYEGQTDHYIPQSQKDYKDVNSHENLIWSCQFCNSHKQAYFDKNCMLFSPYSETDCGSLKFTSGYYYVSTETENFAELYERWKVTSERLFLNSDFHSKVRYIWCNEIETDLISMYWNWKFGKNIEDRIEQLKEKINLHSYKLLVRDYVLPKFKEKYTDFELTHTDLGIY